MGELGVFELLTAGEVAVDQRRIRQRPEVLGWLQFGRIGWEEQEVDVVGHARARLKQLPIKGLYGCRLPFEQYAQRIQEEGRSAYRRWLQAQQRLGPAPRWIAPGSG